MKKTIKKYIVCFVAALLVTTNIKFSNNTNNNTSNSNMDSVEAVEADESVETQQITVTTKTISKSKSKSKATTKTKSLNTLKKSKKLQDRIFVALKEQGYSNIAICAALGNISAESGFRPGAVEKKRGIGIGFVQWSYGRRKNLERYSKAKKKSWKNSQIQVDFFIAELTGKGPAKKYAGRRKRGAIGSEMIFATSSDWKNAKTIKSSTLAFMRFYESPKNKSSYNIRLKKAKAFLKKYKNY